MKILCKAALLVLFFILNACQSYRQVPYIQNSEGFIDNRQSHILFDVRIAPKDLLTITVNSTDPSLAAPFNLYTTTPAHQNYQNVFLYSQPTYLNYLVDNQGCIEYPVLGKLQLMGLTTRESEALIKERIKPFLKEEPIVSVRILNFKISVVGEVNSPNSFSVLNEKINVFEALAMAGDMTIYGKRNDVKIVREDSLGRQSIITLDLNDPQIVLSPNYYLQQNDIVYVTPNKVKSRNSSVGNSTTIWFSIATTLISLTSLIITIIK